MIADCIVCRGAKTVRLPVYVMAVADFDPYSAPVACEPGHREYPCPECSAGVPYERLGLVKGSRDAGAGDGRYLAAVRLSLARELATVMVERGMIRFEQDKPDWRGIFQTRAVVGVVAPSVVATFEERVAERQFEVAQAVVEATEAEISNWGSFYGIQTVNKSEAVGWMRQALQKVKARYAGKS